jgi:hypothetical protein
MFTYKNISDQTQVVPNVGECRPGETITSSERIHNDNFQLTDTKEKKQEVAPEKPKS